VELIPRRLGVDFRRLLGTAWASDLGDGVALAAGPLLVLTQTEKPFLIALATLLQRLAMGGVGFASRGPGRPA
jgi:hypothetical protein